MTSRELEQRVALVTGAGSGIGRAAALLLARNGARVGLIGRTESELRDVEREIRDAGGEALTIVADVADASAMRAAADRLASEFGSIDVVFANAGVNGVWAPIEELDPKEWSQTLEINLTGTFLTVKYAVPHLKKQGGSVIVCSSVNGTRMFSNTGATAYSSSKAGQVAFAKMMALELAKHRVRVNVICPGAIESEIDDNTEQRHRQREKEPVEFPHGSIPLTRGSPGAAEDVAELVLFLASQRSRHITGTEIWIDGAQSLMEG